MSVSVYEAAARAGVDLTEAQRDLLSHLVTAPALTPVRELPVAAADLRIIASLRARILDEMERLTTSHVVTTDIVLRLGSLCIKSLHYVLVETGHPDEITSWVEAALLLLAESKWLSTPSAERLYFAEEARR